MIKIKVQENRRNKRNYAEDFGYYQLCGRKGKESGGNY
jgi:hypothetical protein